MCEYIEMQIACNLLNPQEMRPAYYYYNYLCDFRHRCIATANKVYAPVTQVRKQLVSFVAIIQRDISILFFCYMSKTKRKRKVAMMKHVDYEMVSDFERTKS